MKDSAYIIADKCAVELKLHICNLTTLGKYNMIFRKSVGARSGRDDSSWRMIAFYMLWTQRQVVLENGNMWLVVTWWNRKFESSNHLRNRNFRHRLEWKQARVWSSPKYIRPSWWRQLSCWNTCFSSLSINRESLQLLFAVRACIDSKWMCAALIPFRNSESKPNCLQLSRCGFILDIEGSLQVKSIQWKLAYPFTTYEYWKRIV